MYLVFIYKSCIFLPSLFRQGSFFEELILIVPLGSYDCLYLRCGNTILDVVWKNKQTKTIRYSQVSVTLFTTGIFSMLKINLEL
jgi:hypothetical protein